MKNIRKYTLSGISVLLLLCLAVAVLPTDAFHGHDLNHPANVVCKNSTGESCQHKSHLNNRDGFCGICAVHFDKNFTIHTTEVTIKQAPSLNSTVKLSLQFYQAEIFQHSLRGPPRV